MKKSLLKRRKGLRPVSEKQAAKDAVWRAITDQKLIDLDGICQWCGLRSLGNSGFDGHHIIRRSSGKRIDNPSNCFICHRFPCHQFITDNNIDVREYPSQKAWNLREQESKPKWSRRE